jgi:GT2 family glycosyltransferase
MPTSPPDRGVTIIVPVRNGERWLERTVGAILADAGARTVEVLVVDDGSADRSAAVAASLGAKDPRVRLIRGPVRGAAAAINAGVHEAAHEIVCQVDQDVEVLGGWLATLVDALDEDAIGAAQGVYVPERSAPFLARVTALDLAQRYGRIAHGTDHVCTGNTAYRRSALIAAGLLDEALGYGYDNDLSYRLSSAGYGLVICPGARSLHHWRASIRGYLWQQYGFGYGRLDVLARHPRRAAGDAVSPTLMMAHPVVLAVSLALAAAAALMQLTGGPWRATSLIALVLAGALVIERAWAGASALRRHGDWAALAFPVVHLARDAAWVAAMVTWSIRRALGRGGHPAHSMTPR